MGAMNERQAWTFIVDSVRDPDPYFSAIPKLPGCGLSHFGWAHWVGRRGVQVRKKHSSARPKGIFTCRGAPQFTEVACEHHR
jgi:hypothetical protein